jgi:hypothetical protein
VTPSERGDPVSPDGPAEPPPPGTLTWAVRLLLAEAAGLGVVAAYLVYQDLTAAAASVGVAVALTVAAALGALGVATVARSLARRSAGARGPAVVVQLMLLVTSYYMLQAGQLWLGVPLIALGAGAGILLLAPPTTKALGLGAESE